MLKTVLFDLDGTLLPMDQDTFVKAYFGPLTRWVAPYGYDAATLVRVLWRFTEAVGKNDGACTNMELFWSMLEEQFGRDCRVDNPVFEAFYREDFQLAKAVCGVAPEAKTVLALLKQRGIRRVLATNPIFPAIATEARIQWAGLEASDFEYITTAENSCHGKPDPAYFSDILAKIECRPEECLMVGNDAIEDTAAAQVGIPVFLLTDCLINKENRDLSSFPQGDFPALLAYLKER